MNWRLWVLWAVFAALGFTNIGCEQFAEIDRCKIPGYCPEFSSTNSGGSTTTTTSGGTGGVGGSGGNTLTSSSSSGGGGSGGSGGTLTTSTGGSSGGTGGSPTTSSSGGNGGTGGQMATCGDGFLADDEQCDDSNTDDNDGCSSLCTIDNGYDCVGEPSICDTTCGDGIKAGQEACDDANTFDGDGCEANCTPTPGGTVLNVTSVNGSNELFYPFGLQTDLDNNLILAAYFNGSLMLDGITITSAVGTYDLLISKLDPQGKLIWFKQVGDSSGSGDQQGYGLAVASDGSIAVSGIFTEAINFGEGDQPSAGSHDIFVFKLDTNGQLAWGQVFGNSQDQDQMYSKIVVGFDTTGSVILAGTYYGDLTFGGNDLVNAGDADIFLAKYSADGLYLGSTSYGDANTQVLSSLAMDGDNLILTGAFDGTRDFGQPIEGPLGTFNGFVAKLDGNGNNLWTLGFGDEANQRVRSVAVDSSTGNIFIAGSFKGILDLGLGSPLVNALPNDDIYAASFDAAGNPLSLKGLNSTGGEAFALTTAAHQGRVVLGGYFQKSIDLGGGVLPTATPGSSDAFIGLLKGDNGNHLWSNSVPGGGNNATSSVLATCFDAAGHLWVAGQYHGSGLQYPGLAGFLPSTGRTLFLLHLAGGG